MNAACDAARIVTVFDDLEASHGLELPETGGQVDVSGADLDAQSRCLRDCNAALRRIDPSRLETFLEQSCDEGSIPGSKVENASLGEQPEDNWPEISCRVRFFGASILHAAKYTAYGRAASTARDAKDVRADVPSLSGRER